MTGAAKAPALAWMLKDPSGDAYTVLVLDRLVLFGWGQWTHGTEGLEYAPLLYPSPYAAQEIAQAHTDLREGEGYALTVSPRMHTFSVSPDEAIRRIMNQPYTRPNFMAEILYRGETLAGVA